MNADLKKQITEIIETHKKMVAEFAANDIDTSAATEAQPLMRSTLQANLSADSSASEKPCR